MAKDKALVGAAGVHHVAFQLSARGYAIAVTTPGVEAIDLLAANPKTGKAIAIQVKTTTDAHVNSRKWGPYSKWRITTDLATPSPHSNLLLALVDLHGGPQATPDVFIVPLNALSPPIEVESYPQVGPPRDFWCSIYDKDATNYKNRWDIVEAALGPP